MKANELKAHEQVLVIYQQHGALPNLGDRYPEWVAKMRTYRSAVIEAAQRSNDPELVSIAYRYQLAVANYLKLNRFLDAVYDKDDYHLDSVLIALARVLLDTDVVEVDVKPTRLQMLLDDT